MNNNISETNNADSDGEVGEQREINVHNDPNSGNSFAFSPNLPPTSGQGHVSFPWSASASFPSSSFDFTYLDSAAAFSDNQFEPTRLPPGGLSSISSTTYKAVAPASSGTTEKPAPVKNQKPQDGASNGPSAPPLLMTQPNNTSTISSASQRQRQQQQQQSQNPIAVLLGLNANPQFQHDLNGVYAGSQPSPGVLDTLAFQQQNQAQSPSVQLGSSSIQQQPLQLQHLGGRLASNPPMSVQTSETTQGISQAQGMASQFDPMTGMQMIVDSTGQQPQQQQQQGGLTPQQQHQILQSQQQQQHQQHQQQLLHDAAVAWQNLWASTFSSFLDGRGTFNSGPAMGYTSQAEGQQVGAYFLPLCGSTVNAPSNANAAQGPARNQPVVSSATVPQISNYEGSSPFESENTTCASTPAFGSGRYAVSESMEVDDGGAFRFAGSGSSTDHAHPVVATVATKPDTIGSDEGGETATKPKRRGGRRPKNQESFPEILYRMLEEIEANDQDEILSFTGDGLGFEVHQPEVFEEQILSRYLKTNRFASFRRQLSSYGFKRVEDGPDKGSYRHPSGCFVRGRPDLCKQIKVIKTAAVTGNPG